MWVPVSIAILDYYIPLDFFSIQALSHNASDFRDVLAHLNTGIRW